jgi:hypothetical protein
MGPSAGLGLQVCLSGVNPGFMAWARANVRLELLEGCGVAESCKHYGCCWQLRSRQQVKLLPNRLCCCSCFKPVNIVYCL